MSRDNRYIHGTSPDEQARLVIMNELLNARAIDLLAVDGGERCLEMGAGTGLFACALAARGVPAGSVLAIERDERQLKEARRHAGSDHRNLEFRPGDACDPPLAEDEWGSFDLAHARFLLEHLERPLDAVQAMARAVRPGGRIVLVDDDHTLLRLWPEPEGFIELWRVYWQQYHRLGTDPNIGRRLVSLLCQAGMRPKKCDLLFYGGCAGDSVFPAVVENLSRVIDSARDTIVASVAMEATDIDATLERFRAWGQRDDAVIWYGLPWAEGVRPS